VGSEDRRKLYARFGLGLVLTSLMVAVAVYSAGGAYSPGVLAALIVGAIAIGVALGQSGRVRRYMQKEEDKALGQKKSVGATLGSLGAISLLIAVLRPHMPFSWYTWLSLILIVVMSLAATWLGVRIRNLT
jgi:hypothetical protein